MSMKFCIFVSLGQKLVFRIVEVFDFLHFHTRRASKCLVTISTHSYYKNEFGAPWRPIYAPHFAFFGWVDFFFLHLNLKMSNLSHTTLLNKIPCYRSQQVLDTYAYGFMKILVVLYRLWVAKHELILRFF
jgi:hypothetical protein